MASLNRQKRTHIDTTLETPMATGILQLVRLARRYHREGTFGVDTCRHRECTIHDAMPDSYRPMPPHKSNIECESINELIQHKRSKIQDACMYACMYVHNIQLHKDPTHCRIRSNRLVTLLHTTDYVHSQKRQHSKK